MLNNHKIQTCDYAETLITYLYGEADAREKIAFEAHLSGCAACFEELKEFGAARTTIHIWRVTDFDVLPTPIFEIPAPAVRPTTEAEKSPSWFGDWRRIFSFKPALAMSSLVVLVAFFGIAAVVLNFKNGNQIAKNSDDAKIAETIASPTVEKKNAEPPRIDVTTETAKPIEKNSPLLNEVRKATASKMTPLKVSNAATKNNAVKAAQTDIKSNRKPNATKSEVPRIGDTEDDEDDSIRLADLFEEVGVE